MAYVLRTKDNPGDVGRAADQQQSVDNEAALYAAAFGPGPVATGGVVIQFVKKTGIADATATEVFSITTTNEAGANDGGAYSFEFIGSVAHGIGPTGDAAVGFARVDGARAMEGNGTGGSAVASALNAPATSNVGNKTITSLVVTMVEVSEYVVSVRFNIDIAGAVITTGYVCGNVTLWYAGFTTPPVITSAG